MSSQSLSQLTCFYHPTNKLQNFCISSQCSLPLCSKCINIHLQQQKQGNCHLINHHIQPIQQTKQMIQSQLYISKQAIQSELRILNKQGEYSPQQCLHQYSNLIQKYKQQAIDNINKHYQQIQKQLYEQLKTKYYLHLKHLIQPLEQQLHEINKYIQMINNNKILECMIKVISAKKIESVEQVLKKIQYKKNMYKMDLPRLEGMQHDRLRVVPGNCNLNHIINKGIYNINNHTNYKNIVMNDRTMNSLNQTNINFNHNQDTDRINQLQNKLIYLRTGTGYY